MNKSVKRRVYVGNLSWKVRWQDLKDHMKQVGEVVRADVMEDFDGRSKVPAEHAQGCGIVEYADEEAAARAISQLNDTMLLGNAPRTRRSPDLRPRGPGGVHELQKPREVQQQRRGGLPLRVSCAPRSYNALRSFNSRPGGRESCTILVTNLEWKTTWKDLKDLFRNCGLVLRADVLTQEDGRSKGVGRVTFANEFGARKAVNMYNDYLLFGRRIGVRFEN